MSGIGSAGFVPGVNPYAGNISSTKGTDAARADSSDRSTAADRSTFSQNLNGAGETERSADRDADAFFSASGNGGHQNPDSEDQPETAEDANSARSGSGPAAIDPPLDDHRGNLINFDA
ncbi:MAG: hypothetical protein HQ518_33005 [Rhodopirellula sp.]|nr:hypothetical protein [Rhodopirellula sp.]